MLVNDDLWGSIHGQMTVKRSWMGIDGVLSEAQGYVGPCAVHGVLRGRPGTGTLRGYLRQPEGRRQGVAAGGGQGRRRSSRRPQAQPADLWSVRPRGVASEPRYGA